MRDLLVVLVTAFLAAISLQEVQTAASTSSPWFSSGKDYFFSFGGNGCFPGFNFSTEASVILRVLEGEKDSKTQEILLTFEDSLISYIPLASDSHRPISVQQRSADLKWFSVVRDESGSVVEVVYEQRDGDNDATVFNLKVAVAALLSFNLDLNWGSDHYEGEEYVASSKMMVDNVFADNFLKRLAEGEMDGVRSSLVGEVTFSPHPSLSYMKQKWSSEDGLFSLLSSHVLVEEYRLTLSKVVESKSKAPLRPDNTITASLGAATLSRLHGVEANTLALVQCTLDAASPQSRDCAKRLITVLSGMTDEAVYSLVYPHLTGRSVATLLPLLKVVVLSKQKTVPKLFAELMQTIFRNDSLREQEDLRMLFAVLSHLSVPPTTELVDGLFDIAEHADHVKTGQRALLLLGTLANTALSHSRGNIMLVGRDFSREIVDRIKDSLKKVPESENAPGKRFTRSSTGLDVKEEEEQSVGVGAARRLVLIDALGNAGSPHALDTLVRHATGAAARSLDVEHAAVMALRRYRCEESAQVLLRLAESESTHPAVRHTAASLYAGHPRGRRDIGEELKRNIADDETRYDVSAPSVHWSHRFGERNLSAELTKAQRNSFSLSSDEYSTKYEFSLFDDTVVSAHLELTSGSSTEELIRTQLCYQGEISYQMNMLSDFQHNYFVDSLADYDALRGTIVGNFQTAADRVTSIDTDSTAIFAGVRSALNNLPTRADVSNPISQFQSGISGLSGVDDLRIKSEQIARDVGVLATANLNNAQDLVNSLSPLVTALEAVFPSSIQSQFATFPEVDPGAPLRTLNEISAFIYRVNVSTSDVEAQLRAVLALVSANGVHGSVVDPMNQLYPSVLELTGLKSDLQYQLNQNTNTPARVLSLESLQTNINSHLEVAIETLQQASSNLVSAVDRLWTSFRDVQQAFRSLIQVYESSRSEVDIIFGLRFNTSFPNLVKSCDTTCGCGGFPTDITGQFNMGIDLVVESGGMIYSPVGGTVTLSPPAPMYSGAAAYNSTTTLQIAPNGDNLRNHRIVVSNLVLDSGLADGSFIPAGSLLGVASNALKTCDGGISFVHLEMLTALNDSHEMAVNPTPFLQPILEPRFSTSFECNSLTVFQGGNVVDRQSLSGSDPEKVLLGEPLISDLRILPHEFPQPVDFRLQGTGSYSSAEDAVLLTQSTSIRGGPNLVDFGFSVVGNYSVAVSASVDILSRRIQVSVVPSVRIEAMGSSQVGNAVYSRVTLNGTLLAGSAPSRMKQAWSGWPLNASSAMDLELSPSTLTLTSALLQESGLGQEQVEEVEEEVLQSTVLWQYSVPPAHRNEYNHLATVADPTPPVFGNVFEAGQLECTIRQLPWRLESSPAFVLDYDIADPESPVEVELQVFGSARGDAILQRPHLRGTHITGAYPLSANEELNFVLTARNSQGQSRTFSCLLPDYDLTPPFARVSPSHLFTSDPSNLTALVALFDEHDVSAEVSVGSRAGETGTDVLDWIELGSLVASSDAISFKRAGVLPTSILSVAALDWDDCMQECLSTAECLSFDHSTLDLTCVLHNAIEGPTSTGDYNQTRFSTLPLRLTAGFYHYERLSGVDRSSAFNFAGLGLQHGRTYFINVRIVNGLGYRNVVSSPGIMADFTPPEPGLLRNVQSDSLLPDGCNVTFFQSGECIVGTGWHRVITDGANSETVFNGPIPLVDSMYTSAYQILTANWNGFHDDESGIRGYTWCVGTSVGSCDTLLFEDPHARLPSKETWTDSAFAMIAPDLDEGDYFITVRVESEVEFGGPLVTTVEHTTPYRVDTTYPTVARAVVVGYSPAQDILEVDYLAFDTGSGLADVSVAIGTTLSNSALLSWTSVPISSTPVSIPISVPNGVAGYVKLKVTDKVGLSTVHLLSDTLLVDRTGPVAGRVRDGGTPRSDLEFQLSAGSICVNFDGFDDPHTGISLYSWSVYQSGSGAGAPVVMRDLNTVEMMQQFACEEGLTLSQNAQYFSVLTAFNGAVPDLDGDALNITATSNGVLIDSTPPIGGVARDGMYPGEDAQYSSCFYCVNANWEGYSDNESYIDRYRIVVNHKAFDSAMYRTVYETSVNGSKQTLSLTHFNFHTGDRVRVTVEAYNGAQLSTAVQSDGLAVDLSPPTVSTLQNGVTLRESDHQYITNSTAVTFTWDANDVESGLDQIKLVLYQLLEGANVQVYPNLPGQNVDISRLVSEVTLDGLVLSPGATYMAIFEFVNRAGLRTTQEAPRFTVDTWPPEIEDLTVVSSEGAIEVNGNEAVLLSTPDRIEAMWTGSDVGSGVKEYLLSLTNDEGMSVLPGGERYLSLQDSRVVIESLSLSVGNETDGPFYTLRVSAVDGAGLMSDDEEIVILVNLAPTAGYVIDGENPDEDMDHTHNTATVSAHFFGFHTSDCGGIQHHTWSIGTGLEGESAENVQRATTRGLANGVGQIYLDNLSRYQGQRLYVTVNGYDGCQNRFTATSDGFVIDVTPPVFDRIIISGNTVDVSQLSNRTDEQPFYQSDVYLSAMWSASDEESGLLDRYIVKVGTSPGDNDIISDYYTSSGSLRNLTYVAELEGIPQYMTLTAVNKAGLKTEVRLPPVVMDTSPPVAGNLSCPVFIRGDSCNPNDAVQTQIACTWSGFQDYHSLVSSYSLTIGSTPGGYNVLAPILLQAEVARYSAPVIEYSLGVPYYVSLTAVNNVGLRTLVHSSAIYVDASPPEVQGTVDVLANYLETNYQGLESTLQSLPSSQCILETDSMILEWDPLTDSQSEISYQQIGIGYRKGSDDIMAFTTITPYLHTNSRYRYMVNYVGELLRSIDRNAVFVSVRAFNGANMATIVTSNPLFVSTSANADLSWAWDGCRDGEFGDIDYQTSSTSFCGYFHLGSTCPIRSAEWSLEALDGELVQNFTALSELSPVQQDAEYACSSLPEVVLPSLGTNTYQVSSDQLRLYHNETYRLIVRAFDVTGRRHLLRSDGLFVTVHPVHPGWARDGLIAGYDLKYQVSTTSLSAHWGQFGNGYPEQDISHYEVAVGTDRRYASTKTNIVPFTRVGLVDRYTFDGLNLVPQVQTYYVTVRAHAVSGATIDVTSNGVTVGFGETIVVGSISTPKYQADESTFSAHWTEFESDVPIQTYQWALTPINFDQSDLSELCSNISSTFAGKFNFSEFSNIGLSTAVTANVTLQSGMKYYFILRVLDQGHKCLTVSSEGTLVDTSPPIPGGILVGSNGNRYHLDNPHDSHVAYISTLHDVSFVWEDFIDEESDVDYYEVAIFSQSTCGDSSNASAEQLSPFVKVGPHLNSYSQGSVSFQSSRVYMVVVRAFNKAGLSVTGHSHPFRYSASQPSGGAVKDGTEWSSERVYQSSTSQLSATWAHALLRPPFPGIASDDLESACPRNVSFLLDGTDVGWSAYEPPSLIGLSADAITYTSATPFVSSNETGTKIIMRRNSQSNSVFSGVYRYPVAFSPTPGDSLTVGIAAASGHASLQTNAATSVVLYTASDGSLPQFDVALFETNPGLFSSTPTFEAVGFSVYSANASGDGLGAKVVLWYHGNSLQSVPRYRSAELFVDVTVAHEYSLSFELDEQDFLPRMVVKLTVDGDDVAILRGLQSFTDSVDIAFSLFNQNGFYPDITDADLPEVTALFGNVSFPLRPSGVCAFGEPMHSWEDPVVRMEAAVGTSPYQSDVKDFEVVWRPCLPCIPGPCETFACSVNCTDEDPYTITHTFTNLTLPSLVPATVTAGLFTPAEYFITVKATTASGANVESSSNGVAIDTTPPKLVKAIEHFDVAFDPVRPAVFQSSNSTISAAWEFGDPESGVVEYRWAIGTARGSTDVQNFVSVGLEKVATNDALNGSLIHNSTYYVTVMAVNAAGLTATVSGDGITFIATELNATELTVFVDVLAVVKLSVPDSSERFVSYDVSNDSSAAGVSWDGVPDDVEESLWSIGSQPSFGDILPATRVTYSGSNFASFRNGSLFVNGTAFATLAEVFAIAETKEADANDNLLSLQPGSIYYHTVQFCNVAHKCVEVGSNPGVAIRPQDAAIVIGRSGDILASLQQSPDAGQSVSDTPIPDRQATLVTSATNGLSENATFVAGFLSDEDLNRYYRSMSPYISNPYKTMGQTGTSVSRRFTSVSGPSFYISFLGQSSLLAPLKIEASFDSSTDWMSGRPALLYWDNLANLWREVNETCSDFGFETEIDWTTYTLTSYMCATTDVARRRRQANANETVLFLERPTHFVVAQIGSVIINTAPRLQLPTTSYDVQPHPDVFQLDISSLFVDDEMDSVVFYEVTTAGLGTADLSSSGLLRYTPCEHCIGMDDIGIRIAESSPEVEVSLSDTGTLFFNVLNRNDAPGIFFYDSVANRTVLTATSISVNLDNKRTEYTSVALIGGYDYDGFHDDLSVVITGATQGSARGEIWLDAVGTSESLPVEWPSGFNISSYHDHIAFIGVNISYLPNEPAFVGTDSFTIAVRDTEALFSRFLTVNVMVLNSPCLNGGRCTGAIEPSCTCECGSGFTGSTCETSITVAPDASSSTVCPPGVPLMSCDGDPCGDAHCPSHPLATCRVNYCGGCTAEWFDSGGQLVQCNADQVTVGSVCFSYVEQSVDIIVKCDGVICDCPQQPFVCPSDSVLVQRRLDDCCVQYDCVCPNVSCPVLMECGRGVQPRPLQRGHGSPGYCCPDYQFEDIDECGLSNGLCGSGCANSPYSHQCSCDAGVTLAQDSRTCGVCLYNGIQYFFKDRVKIGCNWCECVADGRSSERWQCTDRPCTPGCLMNGLYRSIGDTVHQDIANCTCAATDTGADWMCTTFN